MNCLAIVGSQLRTFWAVCIMNTTWKSVSPDPALGFCGAHVPYLHTMPQEITSFHNQVFAEHWERSSWTSENQFFGQPELPGILEARLGVLAWTESQLNKLLALLGGRRPFPLGNRVLGSLQQQRISANRSHGFHTAVGCHGDDKLYRAREVQLASEFRILGGYPVLNLSQSLRLLGESGEIRRCADSTENEACDGGPALHRCGATG